MIEDSNLGLERKKESNYDVAVLLEHLLVDFRTTHKQHEEHHFKYDNENQWPDASYESETQG